MYPGLSFDEPTHSYRYNGVVVPGVTSLLDKYLTDFSMVAEHHMEAARQLGTDVHLATELYDRGDLAEDYDPDEEWVPYLNAWKKFRDESGFQIELIEHRVFHPVLGYAGTLDRAGVLNGHKSLIDVKTSASVHKAAGPQLSAYGEALKKCNDAYKGVRKFKRYVVHLREDGTYRLVPFTDDGDWSVFTAILNLENWSKKHGH